MSMQIDPDIAAAMASLFPGTDSGSMPERGDALALRRVVDREIKTTHDALPPAPDVRTIDFHTEAPDGASIPMRWYRNIRRQPGSAILYVHGGGMVCGSVALYDALVRLYAQLTGVPFLAVDYRLAPEVGGTTPAEDTFAALRWLHARAAELGVDTARIGLMGDSAGGGIAAGTAILARDRGLSLARQILIYPMLDDRTMIPDPKLSPFATWTYDNNFTGWCALLGAAAGGPSVSPVAAPARLRDFAGLAPAFIEIGELDIFRDESVRYAQQLHQAGISCELHVHPGAPHGHDTVSLTSPIGERSLADKARVITAI